jgi:hypothetical protein
LPLGADIETGNIVPRRSERQKKGEQVMTLRILAVLMIFAAMTTAEDKPAGKKSKPPSAKTSSPAKVQPLTIPPDAVKISANGYSYTDPQGKKWMYYKTPFGISRVEDNPVSSSDAKKEQEDRARRIESTTAVEDGDTIRFEQPTPFGITRWQRKKGELNDIERAVWEREIEKRAAHEAATNTAKD